MLLIFFLFSFSALEAQKNYWVFFSDKAGVEFDPYKYFDPSAINNRLEKNIPLVQTSDLPVRTDYLAEIQSITGKLGTTSRWFNAVSVRTDKKSILKISELSFVVDVEEIQMVSREAGSDFDSNIDYEDDQLREAQINEFGAKYFEEIGGIDGTGVRIAIFDGGFPGVDTSPMFQHLRENGQIIATWDFVKNREFVYDYSSHGTSVLTCIAGKIDDKKFGLAQGAEFLLARTEITREVFSEEENWLAAVEWADKNGADIISSSLGYTNKRYFSKEMDGKSTLVTRSANLAAAKGMLVINAAGNDGDKDWEVIGAPADADSVLSIGGVNPDNGYHIDFSSYGPTFDGRMKPNLIAFGKVATSNENKVKQSFGTSFSTPLISGFAACVMQIHPEWDNMTLFHELEKSGHLYPYFDYAHGFGVPQAAYFTVGKPEVSPTFEFEDSEEELKIKIINLESYSWPDEEWSEEDSLTDEEMQSIAEQAYYESEAMDSIWAEEALLNELQVLEDSLANAEYVFSDVVNLDTLAFDDLEVLPEMNEDEWASDSVWFENSDYVYDENYETDYLDNELISNEYDLDTNFMYFKIIAEGEQKIKRYAVVDMQFSDEFNIPWEDLESGDTVMVHFKGFTGTYYY